MDIYDMFIALVFFVMGAISLGAGIKGFADIFRIKHSRDYVKLAGVIEDLYHPPSARYNVVVPLVRFVYKDVPYIKKIYVQSLNVKYKVGDEVYVYYKPDPDTQYVRTDRETKYVYPCLLMLAGILCLTGVFCAAAAWVISIL